MRPLPWWALGNGVDPKVQIQGLVRDLGPCALVAGPNHGGSFIGH